MSSPICRPISVKYPFVFWLLFAAIVIVATLLRTLYLELRPFHSDEGVNFLFVERVMRAGYYPYSHLNYHGPSFFYLTSYFTSIFGLSISAFRASAYVPSILMLCLLLRLRPYTSDLKILLMALALALSTTGVFIGRYAIHETVFIFSQLALAIAIFCWHRSRHPGYLYYAGAALALAMTTKETYIIAVFCLFFAFHALGDWRRVYRDLFIHQGRHFLAAILLCIFITVFIFTAGLTWWEGVPEFLSGVQQWMGRNESDKGHFKPWGYYLEMMAGTDFVNYIIATASKLGLTLPRGSWRSVQGWGTEAHLVWGPVLVAVFSLPLFLRKHSSSVCNESSPELNSGLLRTIVGSRPGFGIFCLVWGLLSLIVYSVLNYKTPWLLINITVPLTLMLAAMMARLFYERDLLPWAAIICMLLVTGSAFDQARQYNFIIPYGRKNAHSYVHTHQGFLRMVQDINKYAWKHPVPKVLIGVRQYWPLPYYLRDIKNTLSFMELEKVKGPHSYYDIVIVRPDAKVALDGYIKKYYRLSDVQEAHVYFRLP